MQNKGIVICVAVLLTLASIFYLSFSVATSYYDSEAAKIKDPIAQQDYKDSVKYLGVYSYQNCLETQIGLGLDLKGGMNVILEISVPDVIENLADHKTDVAYKKAMEEAKKEEETSQEDFITLFVKHWKKEGNGRPLAAIFATQQMKGKVSTSSSDAEVERALRTEVQSAVDNSFNVVRNRIDKFGVVQPNIQKLEGQSGRIMVEMPGIKEPERVRKLLQGSANLEFWETYNSNEIVPFLNTLDRKLAAVEDTQKAEADTTVQNAQAEVTTDTTQVAQVDADTAKAAKNDLAAVVGGDGEEKADKVLSAAEIEKLRKQHPLLSRLQLVQGAYGCVVGYAAKRDMDAISELLQTPEAKEVLPADLRRKWGVKGIGEGASADVYELYAIKVTERNGRAPLEGDVVTDANDTFDEHGRPSVSMKKDVDVAGRRAVLTKANLNHSVAIVLDDNAYSATTV